MSRAIWTQYEPHDDEAKPYNFVAARYFITPNAGTIFYLSMHAARPFRNKSLTLPPRCAGCFPIHFERLCEHL